MLVEARNPLNMGAAARAMSNFGFPHMRVVNPYEQAFRDSRSAVGAAELLARAKQYDTVPDAVADCTLVVGTTAAGGRRHLLHPVRTLEEAGRLIRKRLRSGRVALLFGSEKRGLSNDDFTHCHWLVRIPTRDEHASMNLGQAVAVALYELIRGTGPLQKPDKIPAALAGEVERVTIQLLEILNASGFAKPRSQVITEQNVRRMVRRLSLSAADADVWLGMLRQIKWKITSG